jgi:hypothetical protein
VADRKSGRRSTCPAFRGRATRCGRSSSGRMRGQSSATSIAGPVLGTASAMGSSRNPAPQPLFRRRVWRGLWRRPRRQLWRGLGCCPRQQPWRRSAPRLRPPCKLPLLPQQRLLPSQLHRLHLRSLLPLQRLLLLLCPRLRPWLLRASRPDRHHRLPLLPQSLRRRPRQRHPPRRLKASCVPGGRAMVSQAGRGRHTRRTAPHRAALCRSLARLRRLLRRRPSRPGPRLDLSLRGRPLRTLDRVRRIRRINSARVRAAPRRVRLRPVHPFRPRSILWLRL